MGSTVRLTCAWRSMCGVPGFARHVRLAWRFRFRRHAQCRRLCKLAMAWRLLVAPCWRRDARSDLHARVRSGASTERLRAERRIWRRSELQFLAMARSLLLRFDGIQQLQRCVCPLRDIRRCVRRPERHGKFVGLRVRRCQQQPRDGLERLGDCRCPDHADRCRQQHAPGFRPEQPGWQLQLRRSGCGHVHAGNGHADQPSGTR